MRELKRIKQNSNDGEIDLTPMLDVVFIMLIFFIVTASFIKEAGVEVLRPEASTWNNITNQNILVAKAKTYDLIGNTYSSVNVALETAKTNAHEKDLVFVGGSTFVVAEVV